MLRRRELAAAAAWFVAGFAFCYVFATGPSTVVIGTSATVLPHDGTAVLAAEPGAASLLVRNLDLRAEIKALEASLLQHEGEQDQVARVDRIPAARPAVTEAARTMAKRGPPPPPPPSPPAAAAVAKREVGPIVRNPEPGRWPSAGRLCRGCKNQEYIDGNPLWAQPAASRTQFCALIPATSKPAYKQYLEIMAETIGRNSDTNSWLLFNSDDTSEPSDDETYKLCDELAASGPQMRCLIVNVSTSGRSCPRGRKCAAITIFEGSKVLGHDLLASCDWVIKLDPDCVFVPNAAKEFVRKISPQRKVFYGTFSGKLVYSGFPNLWMRTQMPKGNWMVSIATWKRMQETAQAGVCTPNGEYPGTDEAAALLCSWYSWGADCVTNWRNFVRIGPAAETPQNLKEHVDRVKIGGQYGHHECVMLVHKYIIDEMATLYHNLQALPHRDRGACGPEGTELQNSLDYDYNRPAVGGFKFPNKTAIDSTYDCADPSKLKDSGVREPPLYIKEAGQNYKGLTGAEAKEKFKDLPERARNFDNINH